MDAAKPKPYWTVIELLVAIFARVLFENKRNSYVPGGTDAGTVKSTLPLAAPVVPCQATGPLSGAPKA